MAAVGGPRHPGIPLPEDLFAPERKNSAGIDLNDRGELARVAKAVAPPPDFAPLSSPTADALVTRPLKGFEDWSQRSVRAAAPCMGRPAALPAGGGAMLRRVAGRGGRTTK